MAGEEIQNTWSSRDFSPRQIASAITPRVQELIILPTEKCNFRCTYCYEDFKIGRMNELVQSSMEKFLARRIPGLDILRFSWFGGEPLLAKNVVLRLSAYAHGLCSEHGVEFKGGLTTNGYVLDVRLLDALLDVGQDFFQITLDGWGSVHDAVRKRIDGGGTFERIWANLLAMRASPRNFEVLLRIHVRRESIAHLPDFMERLARTFGGDDRFRLDFEHVRDLGGAGGATVKEPVSLHELRTIEEGMRELYISKLPDEYRPSPVLTKEGLEVDLDAALKSAKAAGESAGSQRREDLMLGGGYICYASKPNSLLIRANGRIGKCTVALNDDRNDIGALSPDGAIVIDQDKLRPWLRGLSDLDVVNLGCPWATMPAVWRSAPSPADELVVSQAGDLLDA